MGSTFTVLWCGVVWCGVGVVWSVHCPSVEKECQKTESQKKKKTKHDNEDSHAVVFVIFDEDFKAALDLFCGEARLE